MERTGSIDKRGFLYHVARIADIEAARASGEYRHESLDAEGFIHCSALHQIPHVLDAFYPDRSGIRILVIDVNRLESRLAWEDAVIPAGSAMSALADRTFPHIYGPINMSAVVKEIPPEPGTVHPDTKAMIDHFGFVRLPVEGTLYIPSWRSRADPVSGFSAGSAMIGLYSDRPYSASCFHRLLQDEVWHVYGGDPFRLVLLHPDGTSEDVLMGADILRGYKVQFTVPAGTWQAGHLMEGGRYALFGCTMAPSFSADCFEAGIAADLVRAYPDRAADIRLLSFNGDAVRMPAGYS